MARNDSTHKELVAVCIDRSRRADGQNPEFVLAWKGELRDKQSGKRTAELLGCRMDVRGGRLREVGRCRVPANIGVNSVAAGDGAIFVGTNRQGLAMIAESRGETFDESKGAPGPEIQRMAWLDGQLYMALGGTIARFDPATRQFTILTSSKHVQRRHELDGGSRFEVSALLRDPKRRCLWISIAREASPSPRRVGVWRYSPATNKFELTYKGSAERLSWSDGTLF